MIQPDFQYQTSIYKDFSKKLETACVPTKDLKVAKLKLRTQSGNPNGVLPTMARALSNRQQVQGDTLGTLHNLRAVVVLLSLKLLRRHAARGLQAHPLGLQ